MDSLSALWPYLMGALVGWMASWGLAHRFKYATDSAKTIKVEKVVEKIVEVDRPELLERMTNLEALIEEYEDQIVALRDAEPRVEVVEKRVEIDRPALVTRLAELESTVARYETGLSGPGGARPGVEASKEVKAAKTVKVVEEVKAAKAVKAVKKAKASRVDETPDETDATTDFKTVETAKDRKAARQKTIAAPPEKQTEVDKPALLARITEFGDSAKESGAALTGASPREQVQVEPGPASPRDQEIERPISSAPNLSPRKPTRKAAGNPTRTPTEAQLALPVVETADQQDTITDTATTPGRDEIPAGDLHPRKRNGIDWEAARSQGFKFKDPGKTADFSYVEGIGPKISTLLHDAGISSYHDLANTESKAIRDILDRAGTRYRLADPGTWPEQAGMIADSRWQELKHWKQHHRGGKTGEKQA
jgi:predicted flap endonuclease-1-like 5' DNA nuclease